MIIAMIRSVAVLTVALGLLGTTPASALDVKAEGKFRVESGAKGQDTNVFAYTVAVTDPDGVANDVRIEPVKSPGSAVYDALRISDAGSPITTDAGCALQSDGAVLCALQPPAAGYPSGNGWALRVAGTLDLGAGNDRAVLRASSSQTYQSWKAAGGDGDDRLQAGGGTGPLRVNWIGGLGADTVDGDAVTVDYTDRTAPIAVTVGQGADDGAAGEGDDVGPGVRAVLGGSGNDVIRRTTVAYVPDPALDVDQRGGAGWAIEPKIILDGGPGDDTLSTDQFGSELRGGPGSNTLRGGPEADVLRGESAESVDDLDGGAGNDELLSGGRGPVQGGPGDDVLTSPSGAAQVLDGGPGTDRFQSFDGRTTLTISLDGVANDGRTGEGDNMVNIETIDIRVGTLIGSDGPEDLWAWQGAVYGMGGDDKVGSGTGLVDGGPGRDKITAFDGAVVQARDGAPDSIICATDVSFVPLAVKRLARDAADTVIGCYAQARLLLASTLGKRTLRAVISCPNGPSRCSGTVTLKDGAGRVVATGAFSRIKQGSEATIVLQRVRSSKWKRGVVTTRSPWTAGQSHARGWKPRAVRSL